MAKLSKKRKAEILQERFPEFKKLSDQMNEALDVVIDELNEKLEKMEDIQEKMGEVEDMKNELSI